MPDEKENQENRITVEDIQKPEEELTPEEAEDVKGGRRRPLAGDYNADGRVDGVDL